MHIALYENKMAFPLEGHVRPTLEIILIESPKHLSLRAKFTRVNKTRHDTR